MRLIEKDYYTLGEVVAAWEMPRYDVVYLAETGRMRLSVRVCRTHIERGYWELEEGSGWFKVPEERTRYTGLVDLKEQDLSGWRRGNSDLLHLRRQLLPYRGAQHADRDLRNRSAAAR